MSRHVPDDIAWHHGIARKLALTESAAGAPIKIADPIGRETFLAVSELAYIIEHGQSNMMFEEIVL